MFEVIILAGGESTRLYPVPDKYSIPFFDKTLFTKQLENLLHLKADSYYVIAGSVNYVTIKTIIEKDFQKHHVRVLIQETPKGMWDAVRIGLDKIRDDSEVVVTSFGDVISKETYKDFREKVHKWPIIAGVRITEYFPGGYLVMKDKDIIGIIEKPAPEKVPSPYVNIVFHYFPKASHLKKVIGKHTEKEGGYERSISELLHEFPGKVLPVSTWYPIKYPWHILDVWMHWAKEIKPYTASNAIIHKSAHIEGNVHISSGVRIFENAVVKGPVYLGPNAVIATNALVRESHIGAASVVGFNTEIARSFVADHVWTHSNYIGDSIIMPNVSFGAGCVTGNLRLDEGIINAYIRKEKVPTGRTKYGVVVGSGVRVGVNTSLMPGIYVGENTYIGGGLTIHEPVEENMFVTGEWKLQMKKNKATKLKERDVKTL